MEQGSGKRASLTTSRSGLEADGKRKVSFLAVGRNRNNSLNTLNRDSEKLKSTSLVKLRRNSTNEGRKKRYSDTDLPRRLKAQGRKGSIQDMLMIDAASNEAPRKRLMGLSSMFENFTVPADANSSEKLDELKEEREIAERQKKKDRKERNKSEQKADLRRPIEDVHKWEEGRVFGPVPRVSASVFKQKLRARREMRGKVTSTYVLLLCLALVVPALSTLFKLISVEMGFAIVLLLAAAWLFQFGEPFVKSIITKREREIKTAKLEDQPNRIILVRHGHSYGNLDHTAYCTTADNRIALSPMGKEQALAAGKKLREEIGDETVRFMVSPYKRSRQTFKYIVRGGEFDESKYTVREDVRLREQDFGNFQDAELIRKCKRERVKFGAMYYRFPNGESGADVFDRASLFWGSLYREFSYSGCLENFVVVSHGITIRAMLMRYFRWTVEEFHALLNLENAQMCILELQPNGKYHLKEPLTRVTPEPNVLDLSASLPFQEDDHSE